MQINFASDNYSSVHPHIIDALKEANIGTAPAYGADSYTLQAEEKIKALFGKEASVFFVWNGTSANVLGLKALVKPYQAIICSDCAHINVDEAGAPEAHTGSKLILVETKNGKMSAEAIRPKFARIRDVHAVQPKVVSLTQSTEFGTVYSLNEIKAISQLVKEHDGYLHMDGARLSNAAVSLNCSFREMTTDAGVDIVSFGGTKNGLMGAEAIVILNPTLAKEFGSIRKQGLHLASKMRYLSAQFVAYLTNDLWKQNATHANSMAKLLEKELLKYPSKIKINYPVQANGIFATLSSELIKELHKECSFYVWNNKLNEVRLMCSFDTTEEDIKVFADTLAKHH